MVHVSHFVVILFPVLSTETHCDLFYSHKRFGSNLGHFLYVSSCNRIMYTLYCYTPGRLMLNSKKPKLSSIPLTRGPDSSAIQTLFPRFESNLPQAHASSKNPSRRKRHHTLPHMTTACIKLLLRSPETAIIIQIILPSYTRCLPQPQTRHQYVVLSTAENIASITASWLLGSNSGRSLLSTALAKQWQILPFSR